MTRPFRSRAVSLGICFALSIVYLAFDSSLGHAGEIYGHVTREGKIFPNAQVTFQCPSFSKKQTVQTNVKGRYRLRPGPSGEERCVVSVSGIKNTITIYTSKRRTRVNLDVVRGRLRKR